MLSLNAFSSLNVIRNVRLSFELVPSSQLMSEYGRLFLCASTCLNKSLLSHSVEQTHSGAADVHYAAGGRPTQQRVAVAVDFVIARNVKDH